MARVWPFGLVLGSGFFIFFIFRISVVEKRGDGLAPLARVRC